MTPSQDKKYWRRWAACVRANAWRMSGGRLDAAAVQDVSEPHRKVFAAARQLAAEEALGLNAGHLRHACHIVALGHDRSHKKFTNREFDALLNYWGDERAIVGLLIEPTDLAAIIHDAAPELKQRERLLIGIRRDFMEGYVAKLSHDIYGTKDWETLPEAELENLHHTLHARPHARKSNVSSLKPKVEGRARQSLRAASDASDAFVPSENCPF